MALKSVKLQAVDPFLAQLHEFIGNGKPTKELEEGIFQCGHFNFDNHLEGLVYTFYDNFKRRELGEESLPGGLCECGVADDVENFKKVYAAIIEHPERDFIVSVTSIIKDNEPSSGGWRWHKWGPYIGTKNPQHEYLFDEDDSIKEIIVFHVYEIKK